MNNSKYGRILFLFFFLLLYMHSATAQDITIEKSAIYSDYIKTIRLNSSNKEMSQPVVPLHGGKLQLTFDDLVEDSETYKYTIYPCNYDWTRNNDLQELDYMTSFTEGEIYNFEFSFNTLQSYVRYTLELPNKEVGWTKSGNYMLVVYYNDEPEHPVFQLRFRIYENTTVTVDDAKIDRDSDPVNYHLNQRIDFSLSQKDYDISYPYRDLHVFIQQNNRWDNIKSLKPFAVNKDRINYTFTNGSNVFPGNNEYNNFSSKALKYNSENVEQIIATNNTYDVYLLPDKIITGGVHSTQPDLNGQYKIAAEDVVGNVQLEAEYVKVHFLLQSEQPVDGGDIYILGDFTHNIFSEYTKMEYNHVDEAYTTILYLKQGFYDYSYAFVPYGATKGDIGKICGNYWETGNEYEISAYHRLPGGLYDKLIVYYVFNAIEDPGLQQ